MLGRGRGVKGEVVPGPLFKTFFYFCILLIITTFSLSTRRNIFANLRLYLGGKRPAFFAAIFNVGQMTCQKTCLVNMSPYICPTKSIFDYSVAVCGPCATDKQPVQNFHRY